MTMRERLTQVLLRELLHYDPDTGIFMHIARRPGVTFGAEAGTVKICGTAAYRIIGVDRVQHYAQRLAYLYMTGRWPDAEIDHKDGDGLNNRWLNLRHSTHAENLAYQRRRSTSRTGFKGVRRCTKTGKYVARLRKDGRDIHIGTFATPDEAHTAYYNAARTHFGEFARAN